MPGGLGAPEIIIILLVVLLLFGAKRLPDTARGLGRSLRIFKSEVKAAQDEDGNSPPQQIQATPDVIAAYLGADVIAMPEVGHWAPIMGENTVAELAPKVDAWLRRCFSGTGS